MLINIITASSVKQTDASSSHWINLYTVPYIKRVPGMITFLAELFHPLLTGDNSENCIIFFEVWTEFVKVI
jgi:hypothetical protein